jgi:predicted phage tail protein
MPSETENISAAVQEISEKAQLLVRDEIELAKAEVTQKVTRIAKGAAIAAAAGIFALLGLFLLLHSLSWLAWYGIFGDDSGDFFWGFLIVAGVLFILGGVAGFLANRFIKSGSPPKPDMAIDEAQRIKATVDEARSH